MLIPYKLKIIGVISILFSTTFINLFLPILSKDILDQGILNRDFYIVSKLSFIMFLLLLSKGLLEILQSFVISTINADIRYKMFIDFFIHLERIKIDFFSKQDKSTILANMNTDVNNMSKIIDGNLFYTLTQIFNFIGGIVGLMLISWKLAFLPLVLIPIKYFIIKKFAKINKEITSKYIKNSSNFSQWFGDSISGMRDLRLYNLYSKKETEFKTFKKYSADLEKKSSIIESTKSQLDAFLTSTIVLLVYIFGSKMYMVSEITFGGITAFLQYIVFVLSPIAYFLNLKYLFASIIPSMKRIDETLKMDIENTKYRYSPLMQKSEDYEIIFHNVDFFYSENEPILKNINIKIKKGEKIGIIGDNGSGKSSIINLLLRFRDVKKGEITLNGININELDVADYRSLFAVSEQTTHLFNASVEDNILLNEGFDEAQFDQIIQRSQLSELINNIGKNKKVGLNGSQISSGERQKISIARVLASKRQILIFDEATSNIDNRSKSDIEDLLQYLKSYTVIIITHDYNILKNIDKIVLLKDGNLEVVGTYSELQKNELYQGSNTLRGNK